MKGIDSLERLTLPDNLFKEECKKLHIDIYFDYENLKKHLTALNIISTKNVDMLLIKKYDNASDYNSAVWLSGRDKLTDDEFKMIKEATICQK